jgi:hypothetical protein
MLINELWNINAVLLEGGNSRAVDSKGNILRWKGSPAFAQKIDLGKHGRSQVRSEFLKAFKILNDRFAKFSGFPLWRDFTIITSGHAFNGSSESFFDPSIDDEVYISHKPVVGDIDVSIPSEMIVPLWDFLKNIEGKKLTSKITYVGNNKKSSAVIGEQINAVFEYTDRKGSVLGQVDFEASNFEHGKPSEWAKFSHSSDWADIASGIKGVFHKFMLQSLANVIGRIPSSVELTPASPVVDPDEIKELSDELDTVTAEIESSNDAEVAKDLKKKQTELEKKIKKSLPKIPKAAHGKEVSELTFSVLYGLRNKMKAQTLPSGQPLKVDGKLAYKAIDPSTSGYTNRPAEMFIRLFGDSPEETELKKFRSFTGLLDLISKYNDDTKTIIALRDEFIRRLWGFTPAEAKKFSSPDKLPTHQASQALERDSWETDRDIKLAALVKFFQSFPETRLSDPDLNQLLFVYYGTDGEAYSRLRSRGKEANEIT